MVVDFHSHTFPESIAAAAIQKMQHGCHSAVFTEGTEEALRASMRRSGIDRSVVLPVVTNPLKTGQINELSARLTGRDGLIYFGGVHPDTPDWAGELGRIADMGLKGIKLHPFFQDADFDDVRYLRILDRAGQLGLTVVVHAGDDIGFPGVVRCSPAMIRNALRQVGDVTLVLAHMGGWRNWEQAAALLADTGAYLDTSFSLGAIPPLDDGYYTEEGLRLLSEEQFCRLVRLFGSKRVLFGTDSPWIDQRQSRERILALPLSAEEKEDLLGANARRLLHI